MSEPRAYTKAEVRDLFLKKMRGVACYWANLPNKTQLERCEGVAFSILAEIDGCGVGIPGFQLIPNPHPSDEEYHRNLDENWFPNDVDITGSLHEHFH